MNMRKLIIFEHDSQLGAAASHSLFELVAVRRREGVEVARSFDDYAVEIDRSAVPGGVSVASVL